MSHHPLKATQPTQPTATNLVRTLVRRATSDDLDLIVAFDSTDSHMARTPKNTVRRLTGKAVSGDLYLAFVDGTPAGYARVDMLWPESCPLLAWVFVVEKFRGTNAQQNVYQKLREFVFASLRSEGFTSLLRSACTERPHMIDRLKAEGLKPCGKLTFETGTDEIFFWQPLTAHPDNKV